ncbi:TetR/AcrR family transcriptional regulator [Bradyrhizobium sp. sBnM-33]|uniref:TetR/AcrR family transcriptional regulator n=1 Tax=Bradyrhizobium sp. sBnM-33 TaxID=2831780 RepID=UPI001BCC4870|nr:TetR/AcrR family transcriptional regulator [Bradyrhizobium sp. sBnM-33]WOH53356.1 TetR/AcrR family transcriptional regulator [Bradyrhizobium sp. sBnM-33]
MRKQLTDEQIDAFRGRLVRAAEKLFATKGVEGVTMRQIAKALGYSQTAAYRYFADKDEILLAVRAAALNRFCSRLEAAFEPGRDARENARSVGQAYLQFALDEPDSYRLIFDSRAPEMRLPAFSQTVARFFATMTDYVQSLVDDGHLEGDPVELGRAFWVAAHGSVMMHLGGFLESVAARDQLHQATARLIYRGAAAPGAARLRGKAKAGKPPLKVIGRSKKI